MNEDEILEKIKSSEENAVNEACNALRNHSKLTKDILADLVAALCDINKQDLLYDTTKVHSKHARWLYWYAYKQMTNESCLSISLLTEKAKYFCGSTVSAGVSNMSMMIAEQPIWAKRWAIIKRIINKINEVEKQDITVKIKHPQGVNIEIKQE